MDQHCKDQLPSWILLQVKNGITALCGLSMYHLAKFGGNISNGGRIIAIFHFSKWRPATLLDFDVSQKCYMGCCWLSMATNTPNLLKISQIAAELWRFCFFQNGGWPPSWILFQTTHEVYLMT